MSRGPWTMHAQKNLNRPKLTNGVQLTLAYKELCKAYSSNKSACSPNAYDNGPDATTHRVETLNG